MDGLYTRAAATASQRLKKYAQGEYKLTRHASPVVDPDAPWQAPEETAAQAWILDAIGRAVSTQFVDGKTILTHDREVLAAVFGDTPRPGDVLSKDGVPLTVIRVMPVTDAGVAWRFIVKA
jgi:hypothetical protein